MATTYINFVPDGPDDGTPRRMRTDSNVNALEQMWRREDAEAARYAGLTGADRAVAQAIDRVERDFAQNFGDYSRTTLQDAVDGYYDFSMRLERSFDKARAAAPAAHRDAVNNHLDLLQRTGTGMALDHWHQQDQALNQRRQEMQQPRIQLAQVNKDTMTDTPLMNSVDPNVSQPSGKQQINSKSIQSNGPGGMVTQSGLNDQLFGASGAPQAVKPDFDGNLPQSAGTALEGRVASTNSSIEDSTDANAGLGRERRDLFRSPLDPHKKEQGPYDQPVDLLQGKKPSGVGCTVTNGMMTCTTPAGRTFTVPAPPGFSSFKPGDKDYHSYSYGIGPSVLSPTQLMNGVINAPTPGPQHQVKPANADGVLNEAQPAWQMPIANGMRNQAEPYWQVPMFNGGKVFDPTNPPYWSPVKTYLTTDQYGNQMVVNVTEPGHPLWPGYVARYIVHTDSGSYIANEGEGTGPRQAPGAIGQGYINGVWKDQSRDIINRLK